MQYKIYLVTNTINGKKYVGQTKQELKVRWYSHKWCAKHPSKKTDQHLYNSIRKYGIENFELTLLEDWDTLEEANDAERWWIKILDTTNEEFGYNGLEGGHFQPSPDVGRRISEGKKKAFRDHPEVREKMRLAKLGKKLSSEHAEKVSRNLIRNAWTGRKHTEEEKKNLSEKLKIAYLDGRHRKTEGLKKGTVLGPMSDEEKLKRSEGVKKARANKFWSTKKKELKCLIPQ